MSLKTAKLQRQVDDFNAAFPPGSDVNVRLDDGTIKTTKTRSAADLLGGHTPVVWLDGISGCYLLNRVTALVRTDTAVPQAERSPA